MEYSTQYAREGATGEGSARIQHQFKVDPNKVRGLDPGKAYLISRGRAMKIQMPRAPAFRAPLPAAAPQGKMVAESVPLRRGSSEEAIEASVLEIRRRQS